MDLLTPRNDRRDASDQLANRIKFDSDSFHSIKHDFHSKQFPCDKHEITAYYTTIQINVFQPVIDVDD